MELRSFLNQVEVWQPETSTVLSLTTWVRSELPGQWTSSNRMIGIQEEAEHVSLLQVDTPTCTDCFEGQWEKSFFGIQNGCGLKMVSVSNIQFCHCTLKVLQMTCKQIGMVVVQ